MPDWLRRRRWPWILLAALVVLIVAAVIVKFVVLHDEARTVTVDEAVDRYHESTTSSVRAAETTTTAAPSLPKLASPGVYRYRTSGRESIDVLGGADHGYPAETTITVTAEGCGLLLRWDALRERRDEWRLCATTAGIELQGAGLQYHEFFGRPDSEDVLCDGAVLLVPTGAPPPSAAPACTLGGDPWQPVWSVLESTTRDVAGQAVDVRHVRMTVTDDDEYGEHTVVDWYLDGGGLPVATSSTKDSVSPSPIGAVTYHEEYTTDLLSLEPIG